MAGGGLYVAQVNTSVEHRGDEGVPEHVWVHPWQLDTCLSGEASQSPGGAVSVHPRAARGDQDRSGGPFVDGPLDGTADGWGKRDEDDLVALAVDTENPENPVAVARIMYAAVLDAEASRGTVGEACVVTEHAVLRATAAGDADRPVILGDHVFVGPHATLLGCTLDRCVYIGTGATMLHGAALAAGAVVAVGALVHARTTVPAELFVPPHTLAIGTPARIFTPDQTDQVTAAIREANFAGAAFGVQVDWDDRITRYEQSAEVRVAEFGAHRDDEILN